MLPGAARIKVRCPTCTTVLLTVAVSRQNRVLLTSCQNVPTTSPALPGIQCFDLRHVTDGTFHRSPSTVSLPTGELPSHLPWAGVCIQKNKPQPICFQQTWTGHWLKKQDYQLYSSVLLSTQHWRPRWRLTVWWDWTVVWSRCRLHDAVRKVALQDVHQLFLLCFQRMDFILQGIVVDFQWFRLLEIKMDI